MLSASSDTVTVMVRGSSSSVNPVGCIGTTKAVVKGCSDVCINISDGDMFTPTCGTPGVVGVDGAGACGSRVGGVNDIDGSGGVIGEYVVVGVGSIKSSISASNTPGIGAKHIPANAPNIPTPISSGVLLDINR